MYTASNQGHVECLKELIAAGADINKEDKDDGTALMFGRTALKSASKQRSC